MKKKPVPAPMPHKPKRIVLPAPEDLSVEELAEWQLADEDAPEAYRQGHFLILFAREEQSSMVADLNGKTVIHHQGALGEVSALLNALQNVKWQNERVYEETFKDLSDEAFMQQGMMVLDDATVGDLPDADDILDIYNASNTTRDSFLDELIKPPKKKP